MCSGKSYSKRLLRSCNLYCGDVLISFLGGVKHIYVVDRPSGFLISGSEFFCSLSISRFRENLCVCVGMVKIFATELRVDGQLSILEVFVNKRFAHSCQEIKVYSMLYVVQS